jgi:putative ABC transport system ATP-binding protein
MGMTSAVKHMDFATGDVPQPDIIILTHKLTRDYELGSEIVHALRDVSLQIKRNEFTAIMGPSGSGKSTLMNLIGCLDTPTRGEYWLNSQKVSELDDDELARIVELPLIYAGKSAKQRKEQAADALERVGLGDRMEHRPNELSGGQRQRVAIARALVNEPSILLADEPTGNLDSHTGAEIMEVFEALHDAGQTILLITHESNIAVHAGRQIHLLDGYIEQDVITERVR